MGSVKNTGYQLEYPIGVPIWALQKTNFNKVINKTDKLQSNSY